MARKGRNVERKERKEERERDGGKEKGRNEGINSHKSKNLLFYILLTVNPVGHCK